MTEEGALAATELWEYSKALGITPREALEDPDLAFNVSVMRGYMKARKVARDLAAAADPIGAAVAQAAGED